MLLEKSYYLIVREHVSHLKRRIGLFTRRNLQAPVVKTRSDGNFAESYLSEGKNLALKEQLRS